MYLNGKAQAHHISEKTCARIREIMLQENYQPNVNARAMALKKTNLIGCVLRNELESSFWMEILSGLNEVFQPHNYHLVLMVSSRELTEELKSFEFLRAKGVDAYVWVPVIDSTGAHNTEEIRRRNPDRPVITMTYLTEHLGGVAVDEQTGGQLAAKCFIANGHTHVAAVGSSQVFSRGIHFQREMAQAGIDATMFPDLPSYLPHIHDFTAVFCFSDMLALELYRCCVSNGLKIPQDVSIIGYDNMPFTSLLNPALTTIHQPKRELGRAGGELILEFLNAPAAEPRQIKLVPELIERDSVRTIKRNISKQRSLK